MTPKQFIQQVFISELDKIKSTNSYISFALIATGIEFLGKCLDNDAKHWNVSRKSKFNFEYAINHLDSLILYRPYLTSHKLWDSLRNGFAHSFVPKYPVTLSSKDEASHLLLHENNERLNLKCEDFYNDFKNACIEVVNMEFSDSDDKMNKQLLSVPELE
ncbi:MAG: hypothetical protein AABY54_09230 [Deltaproteobacteria bacterium]